MNCPVCEKSPMITLELDSVEIDCCQACGGIWLDTGELEMLFDDPARAKDMLKALRPAQTPEKNRKCPICLKSMKKILLGMGENTQTIDACPRDHGLWFDRGELGEIIRLGATGEQSRVLEFLADIFEPE